MWSLLSRWFMAVALSATWCAAAQEPPLKQVQVIHLEGVEGRIDHLAVNLETHRLYVVALGNNTVEVIDLKEQKRVATIDKLNEPQGVGVLPDSGGLVVASGRDGKCRIYDAALKIKATIDDLDDADNVRSDDKSGLAFVGYGSGAIAAIDAGTGRKSYEVKLDGHPESFQLERDGNARRIFVNVPSARQVAVVDREKREVVARWPMNEAQANFPMALDERNHRLFVGCRKPAALVVLDTESGKPIQTLACCGDTDDVFYDAELRHIYLTGGEGCITVFEQSDADHYKHLSTIATAAGARTSLFVPQLRMLFVAVPHRGKQAAEVRAYTTEVK